ncbi:MULTISPECIES: endonuclease/exonuclease/phosphatase family protein [Streptomyces]|uniref:endonuclease/exonuclease/phosphatase family protein n=1 Tax=Streptomyces TaxID=1883 RepID=UPI000AC558BC|nr:MULTISPECIES: endonuclease/exonuclease/phosphatase family protein [Streptomyces]MBX9424257.1 endonuclease/exonuclease/phosphatase family protein [Streptomyces lateritius]
MDRAPATAPVESPSGTSPAPADPEPPPLRPRHPLTAWAAGLLLVVPALLVGCRVLDEDGPTPVPQLLSLLPWFAVPAALGVLLAVAARRRALVFTAVVVLTATVWASLPHQPQLVTSYGLPLAQVRVLASNVEFGQGTAALTEAIRRERPQLVFVSECDRACGRALSAAFASELPHRASVDADGSVGSVLLSAYPLRDEGVIPAAMGMPGATAVIAGVPVRLQLAHPLPPVPGQVDSWRRELGRIEDAARDRTGPLLLAGDFNASQDHAAFRSVLEAGHLQDAARLADASRTPTWPMEGSLPPFVQIDHVLVSEDFTVRGIRFLDVAGSDHRAVLTDLDLRGGR